jgi:STE24 endopeptidase
MAQLRHAAVILFLISIFIPAAHAQVAPQSVPEPHVTAYHLDPPLLERAESLYRIRVIRYIGITIYSFLLIVFILRTRLAFNFRSIAERVTRSRWLQALIFTPLLMLTISAAMLPFDAHGHGVAVDFGLSVQSWTGWFSDWLKSVVLETAIASLLACGFFALVRRSPKRWWLFGWLLSLPVVIFMVFIAPVVIDPIFNHYDRLAATRPELTRQVQEVAQRGGLMIPESRIFEMRASEKVTTYNAYVTGIGVSKRIVVWDTTARDLTSAETLSIFGHELGHYVLNHIWQGLAVLCVGLFVGFWLTFQLYRWSLARWGTSLGIAGQDDLVGLPLLLLIAMLLSFLSSPIENAFSRHLEHQADVYGLEVTHGIVPESNEAAAASFQKLGERSLSIPNPNPLLVFWTYSHPPIADRIRFANEYRPWDRGQPGQFIH